MKQTASQEVQIPPSFYPRKWEIIFNIIFISFVHLGSFYHLYAYTRPLVESGTLRGISTSYFGSYVDSFDHQFRNLREGFTSLTLFALVHILAIKAVTFTTKGEEGDRSPKAIRILQYFQLFFGISFVTFLHGVSILLIFVAALIPFFMVKVMMKIRWKAMQHISFICVWAYSLATQFFISDAKRVRFGSLLGSRFSGLDSYSGVYPWTVGFNLCLLKIVSFCCDYSWALNGNFNSSPDENAVVQSTGDIETTVSIPEPLTYKEIARKSHSLDNYQVVDYISYLLYPPLWIAGPTTTFNSFFYYMKSPQQVYKNKSLFLYLLHWIGALIFMEFLSHFNFPFTLFSNPKNRHLWSSFGPLEIMILPLSVLLYIYLKFLIIWRYFRLWALFDGICPPENMTRCVFNHYSAVQFWRTWHCSFNQWLIRYLYLPLGGNKCRLLNTLVVFTYVAIWHDLELKLFAWAWLIVLFIAPELLARSEFSKPRWESARNAWYWKYVCMIGAAANIMTMIISNLVGFSFGTEGADTFMRTIFEPATILLVFPTSLLILYNAINLMFAARIFTKERL